LVKNGKPLCHHIDKLLECGQQFGILPIALWLCQVYLLAQLGNIREQPFDDFSIFAV